MIIADTGFWVALFDARDNHHQAVYDYAPMILDEVLLGK